MRQAARHCRQNRVLGPADVFRVGAEDMTVKPEHLVALAEGGDICAGGLDLTGQHHTQDAPPRPGQAQHQPGGNPVAGRQIQAPHITVAGRHCRRRNPDANLVRAGNRHRHIFDPKDLRRPVPRAHNRFHPLNPFRPCRVPRQPLSWPLPGCSGHRKHVPPPHPAGQHRATSHQAGPALPAATNAVNRQPPQPPAPASHADRPDLRGTAGSAAMPADRAERRKCALR